MEPITNPSENLETTRYCIKVHLYNFDDGIWVVNGIKTTDVILVKHYKRGVHLIYNNRNNSNNYDSNMSTFL